MNKKSANTGQTKHIKSNLITLLKTFSKAEMKELAKFAKSPFFNKRKDVIKYITLLVKSHPAFEVDELVKEKLHSHFYPGKKFQDLNIRRLNSNSLSLVEDYLYYNHGERDPYEKDNYIILEYIRRDGVHLAASKIDRCLKELKLDSLLTKDYFERRAKLNSYKSLLEKYKKKDNRYGDYLLKASSDNITSSLAELATNFITLYMEKSISRIDLANSVINSYFNNLNIEQMLSLADKSNDENFSLMRLNYLMANCLQNTQDDEAYKEFNQLLTENESKLSHDTLVQYGMFRYDYIFQKLKDMSPKVVYLGMYELTKELCMKNLLKFSYEPYIVNGHGIILGAGDLAASKGDIDFLVYLQVNLVDQLHPEFRFLTGQFLKLHENYIRKNYDECVKILNTTPVDHYLFYSRFKILEVQIFFDMGEYERVLNLVDAFKHFYKKRHISAKFLGVVIKFLNVVAHLSKLDSNATKHEIYAIEKSIQDVEANILRNWLLPRFKSILGKLKKTI